MTNPAGENTRLSRWRTSRYRWAAVALAGVVFGAGGWWAHVFTQRQLQVRLLRSLPDQVMGQRDLVAAAVAEARPLYSRHCAACHGANLHGNQTVGAPDLTDQIWLYGNGSVFDIERTVLYGIRSGMAKSHDLVDMPPFGQTGVLTPDEIRQLAQYVLQLSGAAHDSQSALAGRELYRGNVDCGSCHGADGKGNYVDGAPALTTKVWNNGGDAQSLYNTLYFGLHKAMPGWIGTLTLGEIRALAVYVHVTSHPAGQPSSTTEPYVAADPQQ